MTATPLRPPLLLLQHSWQRYRQAPVLLAGWALGWMLLGQLMALLPLPIWLQFGASLLCFSWASAGLIDLAQRQSPLTLASLWLPLRRAPWPLLLLPLLIGTLVALASLAFVLPGVVLLLAWSLALPLLLDRGGEAWDAMVRSAQLVVRQRQQVLVPLLLLWGLTLLALGIGWWLLGLWLPLAAFLLQALYSSVKA